MMRVFSLALTLSLSLCECYSNMHGITIQIFNWWGIISNVHDFFLRLSLSPFLSLSLSLSVSLSLYFSLSVALIIFCFSSTRCRPT
jgi:hypothetical protein